MLAAHRAVELGDQIDDGGHHVFHLADFGGQAGVDQGPDVEAADAGMAVVARVGVEPIDDLPKAIDELGEPGRLHGTVFDESNGFAIALRAQQQAQSGLPHVPDADLVGGIERPRPCVAKVRPSECLLEAIEPCFEHRETLVVELDDQNGAR